MAIATAKKMETATGTREPARPPPLVSPPKTTVLGVANLEGSSLTGLYVKDRMGVRPLNHGENPWNKELLVRTGGLSKEQAEDLRRQGVAVLYLREVPTPVGMSLGESSEGIYRSENRIALGTEVVPYASVNDCEIRAITNRMSIKMMAGCG